MQNESILPFPKRREKSVLYKVVSENLNTFLELGFVNGGVPEYVEKEFNAFLPIGDWTPYCYALIKEVEMWCSCVWLFAG